MPPIQRVALMSPEQADKLVIEKVPPVYPEEARKAHKTGTVHLEITTATDGHVMVANVVDGDPLLGQAAKDAVLKWRYKPLSMMGIQQQMSTKVEITFADPAQQAVAK